MFLHFIQSKEHKEAFMDLAQLVAKADGYISGNEERYLQSFRNEMNMEVDMKQSASERNLSDIIESIKDEQVKNIFMVEILLLVFSDGDYSEDEQQIVLEMKRIFGISDETYDSYKKWVIRVEQLKVEGLKLILNPTA
ncbi:TerB family tellurite resistance protein [Cohnella sp. WQ 127256]|uniref:TerB family tellurite resistance protein n=1 Tax=Cohnella sp. WQ 127256 TaxID=2938790 RepID=UPI0021191C72|nr:TerB family tellurite resistance protein [Cohnella sp. WQ 127256]